MIIIVRLVFYILFCNSVCLSVDVCCVSSVECGLFLGSTTT